MVLNTISAENKCVLVNFVITVPSKVIVSLVYSTSTYSRRLISHYIPWKFYCSESSKRKTKAISHETHVN
jgi:hypothetical protein